MLSVQNVCKTYASGERAAVNGVSLELGRCELLTLVGESGCGKTTLLRLIAGLETADSGAISVAERSVVAEGTWVAPEKRNIGMVFQGGALFPHLTIEKNIAYGLSKMPREERAEIIEEHLKLVRLSNAKKRYPHELSGGERQRVALVRALAPKPAIILLDEPFSNLDTGLKSELREEVCTILRAKQMTAVLVTHDPRDVRKFGDCVAVMRAGQIEQIGLTENVVSEPANAYCSQLVTVG